MADILDPNDEDLIIDPACGSGGFLIESLRHVWRKLDAEGEKYHWNKNNLQEEKMEVALNKIRGIDKDYFLSKVSKAYMAIMGDGKSGIFSEDSLENPENWQDKTRLKIDMGKFSVLLTNPPFGSKIPVRGEDKLKQFEFGYKWKFDNALNKWVKTEKLKEQEEPQVLFIERCLALLKDGGRMAMVLPSGILGNEQEAYLRQYIQEKGNLFAIVEMPFETFSPNVSINTSVLFIQKGKSDKKNIFISINEYCGHDKKGRPIEKDDFPMVADFYKNKKENDKNFFINSSLVEDNFVAKRYLKKYTENLEKINKSKYPRVFGFRSTAGKHTGLAAMLQERPAVLLMTGDSVLQEYVPQILAFAAEHRLPVVHQLRENVVAGGLLSYGTNRPYLSWRAAVYIDKVLKGAKPADLPLEQPTKFELVINLKTAQALGLTIPPSLLFQANEVIR
jgi:type I restriction-modification system DNA methylase subunit